MAGIYRRSVMLASGRYAMLDDGMGFSLVPWKPVIEQRLGQQLAATVRGGGVSWEIGRQRGRQSASANPCISLCLKASVSSKSAHCQCDVSPRWEEGRGG